MIAKGVAHRHGVKLASYLITGKENEIATLWKLRGFASDDIHEAFRSVHLMAAATRAEQPFFHVQVRNPNGETLTRQQWERIADRIEAKLRLIGQPRAIAFHLDRETGHEHMHIAFSRIDPETMTARSLPFFKLRLKEVCRDLEIELGLTRVTSERREGARAPLRYEQEQARRLGTDLHQIRATVRDCWDRSDDGGSFVAALAENGLVLARGERRDYIIIDPAGGMHALGKRMLGHSAAEVRARFADLDVGTLPTVEQARSSLGIQIQSRPPANPALLAAIENREPGEVLNAMTLHRATFTARDLDRAVGKQIESKDQRQDFVKAVLEHRAVIRLLGDALGSAPRYTTNSVLENEEEVLRASDDLVKKAARFDAGDAVRRAVLSKAKFDGISREQVKAVRHAVGAERLAIVDGQAGTGKSHTAMAVREIYEAKGCKVVGLAPTNVVAQDMKENGFAQARTLHGELLAIDKGRTKWTGSTVVILDEAAMVDTRNLARLAAYAKETGAKLVLMGDDRQLSSVERSGMFALLKARHGAAELKEVRRQQTKQDRRASALMAEGDFRGALDSYAAKGGIHWASCESDAADALVQEWTKDTASSPGKARFVFAYTNREVDELNCALREIRVLRGEIGQGVPLQTNHGLAEFAEGDRIMFTGTDHRLKIYNGQAGTIRRIEGTIITVALDGRFKRTIEFDATAFQDFRHGYAGTIYKGQGRTLDQTYLLHGVYWRSTASYVALTRHREKTDLFVSRETAADLTELASQMSRIDDRRAASHFRREIDYAEAGNSDQGGSARTGRRAHYGNIPGPFRKCAARLSRRLPFPKPRTSRRRGDGTGGAFSLAARLFSRRVSLHTIVCAAQSAWDALDWLHLWEFNAVYQLDQDSIANCQNNLFLHL